MSHLRIVRTVHNDEEPVDAVDAGPLGVSLQEDIGARAVDMLEEWIERWKRARRNEESDHASGRREGYLQAIAFLLDRPVREVRAALERGEL